jgi:hypothetical protein
VLYFVRYQFHQIRKHEGETPVKSKYYRRHVVNSSRQHVTDDENRNLCQPRMWVYLRPKQPQVCICVIVCMNNSWLILQISTQYVGVLPHMAQNNDTFPTKAYALDKITETTFLLWQHRHRPPPRKKEHPRLLKRRGSTVNSRFNGQNPSVLPLYSPAHNADASP